MKVRSIHERYDNYDYAMMMPNCFNVTVVRAVSPLFDIFMQYTIINWLVEMIGLFWADAAA